MPFVPHETTSPIGIMRDPWMDKADPLAALQALHKDEPAREVPGLESTGGRLARAAPA
jgi:hypothetical protein